MKKFSFALAFLCLAVVSSAHAAKNWSPSRYVTVNSKKVAVYESDGHQGPGILLVHGNTSSAQSFSRLMETPFGHQFRLVALDMPGYGNSENQTSYNIKTFTDAIVAVAQATHVDHGVVVGWSLGGDLSIQASQYLPHVKGFFTFGTVPIGYAPELPSPFLTPEESYAGEASSYGAVANLTTAQIDAYVTAFFRPSFQPIPTFFFDAGHRTDPGTRQAVLNAVIGADPTFIDEVAAVRAMTVPFALVAGQNDAFIRPEYMTGLAPSIAHLWRGHAVFVPNTGHAIHWERPLVMATFLRSFLNDTK